MIVFSSLQIRRGVRVLLDNATATINPGQKVGLVGKNGCGKSTLLSLLKNEISADGGSMTFPGNWQLAWVNQETPALPQPAIDYVIDGDREYRQLEAALQQANERNDGHAIATVHGKLDAIDAWTIRSRAASLLHGLGFSNEQLERPVSDFSGGWRMRLNLAQALICRSDLLLLDEPTNHLDLDAVIWLEKWLKGYTGTLILISHDRDFLDPIVDKIIHIEQQTMFEYTGNYSSFEVQRATRLAQQQAMYESQQQRVAHLQSYIDRFRAKATKAKQAQSRIKMLERMELIAPAHVDNPFHFSFRQPESLPNPLLKMEKVSAGYGERIILDSIKLNLVPGSRIGLLGRNGAGKSTLIKLLAGELHALGDALDLPRRHAVALFDGGVGLRDGHDDLGDIERRLGAVALNDLHFSLPPPHNRKTQHLVEKTALFCIKSGYIVQYLVQAVNNQFDFCCTLCEQRGPFRPQKSTARRRRGAARAGSSGPGTVVRQAVS